MLHCVCCDAVGVELQVLLVAAILAVALMF